MRSRRGRLVHGREYASSEAGPLPSVAAPPIPPPAGGTPFRFFPGRTPSCGCAQPRNLRRVWSKISLNLTGFQFMTEPHNLITKAEFSRRLEVSKARVSQMIGMGCPVTAEGLIPFAEALEWVGQNVARVARKGVKPSEAKPLDTDGENLPALVEARTRLLLVQVERGKVALAKEHGSLVDREASHRAIAAFSRQIRDQWLNFANRHGAQIAASSQADPRALMAALDKAVRAQLAEIAMARTSSPLGASASEARP